jgi:ubiquinone/menaquinone biosynthesis C-methylase UbiE
LGFEKHNKDGSYRNFHLQRRMANSNRPSLTSFREVDNRWNQHPKTKSLFQVYYYFYFLRVLPVIGGLFSSFSAYGYLPDSVLEFPSREDFKGLMSAAGFSDPRHFDLTFGIATVYVGKRGSRSKPCCCVD